MSLNTLAPFIHAESGMTRFPPNIEQITVEPGSTYAWLKARRNDTELRFPLGRADVLHLIGMLEAVQRELGPEPNES